MTENNSEKKKICFVISPFFEQGEPCSGRPAGRPYIAS